MRRFVRFWLYFFIFFFILSSIAIIGGAAVLYKYSKTDVDDEIINAINSKNATSFYLFEHSGGVPMGNPIEIEGATLSDGIRYEYVTYNELPENLVNAFIAIEDKRFFTHQGIDYKRSAGAVLNYALGSKESYGGSTITQQLVKNLTGNDERIVKRKLGEAFSAINLEKRYDKSEILEMYLNIINLANRCRGVGGAAKYYFSKPISELTLCECACIAAITNNPSKYDPIRHPENNEQRRKIVLKCMLDLGYINEFEYQSATEERLVLNVQKNADQNINSWYIDAVTEDVISDLAEKYRMSRQNASLLLFKGGYKIYTAMDGEIQNILTEYFENTDNFLPDEGGEIPQASMVIINPATGDILGIAGGVGKKSGNRIQSYATTTKRPPGSAIKPLSVYAPAIDRGLVNWATVIEDSPVIFWGDEALPWPSNANKKYVGNVTVKYALANSLNTVAVKLLKLLGNEKSYNFLTDKLHISSLNKGADMGDASLALGQPSRGVTLRELTAAYTIFSEGVMSRPRTYYKVTDENGRIILDNKLVQESVITQESAAIMTKLLQTVVHEGTATGYITLPESIEVAGKTGTTQYSQDKYFVGYTPGLLGGVWQGYELPRELTNFKGNYSICIWDDIFNEIYEKTEYKNANQGFKIPSNVTRLSYNKESGLPPSDFDAPEKIEEGWFRAEP